jgi:hypothetical protein
MSKLRKILIDTGRISKTVMTSQPVSDDHAGPLPPGDHAEECSNNSWLNNEFFGPSANSESEELFDFQWSTQHYRVHQLVRAFCEQTKSNFEAGE